MSVSNFLNRYKRIAIRDDLLHENKHNPNKLSYLLFRYYNKVKHNISFQDIRLNRHITSIEIINIESNNTISKLAETFLNYENDRICGTFSFYYNDIGHAYVLIYIKSENSLIVYDPNGADISSNFSRAFTQYNKDLFLALKKFLPPNAKLISSREIHHLLEDGCGLQNIAGNSYDEGGFCQLWSVFMVELIMSFPEIPVDQLIKDVYLNSLSRTIRETKRNLKSYIKGFYFDTLKKLAKDPILEDVDVNIFFNGKKIISDETENSIKILIPILNS